MKIGHGLRGRGAGVLGVGCAALIVGVLAPPFPTSSQIGPGGSDVVEAGLTLRRLDGVKRVLMIGAHPDDEDTSLLAALAHGMGVETAYLSLTRGEGGQNILGPELGEGLGIIRTGELEAARAMDGGRQFFTRAFDFGFSKSADEAFARWPREEVLRDIVWVIRTFRPHVVVSVFSGTPRDGHGHHQAAGILAREAFDAAADPTRFADLPGGGERPWEVAKLYVSLRFSLEPAPLRVATGTYDPLLGRSYLQLAMESRSQHRSQEMGAPQPLGPGASGLRLLASRVEEPAGESGLFAGVDTTLAGLVAGLPENAATPVREHLRAYRVAIYDAAESLDAFRPQQAARPLAVAHRQLEAIFGRIHDLGEAATPLAQPLAVRAAQIRWALMKVASIVVDVRASDDFVTAGEDVDVDVRVWNGGPFALEQARVGSAGPGSWAGGSSEFIGTGDQTLDPRRVGPGEVARWTYRVRLGDALPPSRLYYLESPRIGDIYRWTNNDGSETLPRNWRALLSAAGEFEVRIPGIEGPVHLVWGSRAQYVGVDPAMGEYRAPVLAMPAVSVEVEPDNTAWPLGSLEGREVRILLRSESRSPVSGRVGLEAPEGWEVAPADTPFALEGEGSTRSFAFRVEPSRAVEPGDYLFRAVAIKDDAGRFDERVDVIDYPHIERTLHLQPARMRVTALPVAVAEDIRVGYVTGSGDDGLRALRQMGVDVEEVPIERVREGDYSPYDVLVLGIRVYETRPDLVRGNAGVLDFARAGGTVIVQYNKFEYPRGGFAPYPVSMGTGRSAPRVTDEASPVTLLDPAAPVFNSPNRITAADFEGWVQERGLYFLSEWDERFRPLLALADPGEDPARGSLLVAPVGEGVYVYVALSLFRQLPAGVPGAYRLFANLVSLDADSWNAHHGSR